MPNYTTEQRYTMRRRTQWLEPTKPTDVNINIRNTTNAIWCEAEALALRCKGVEAEVRTNELGQVAVFATGSFISNTSYQDNED